MWQNGTRHSDRQRSQRQKAELGGVRQAGRPQLPHAAQPPGHHRRRRRRPQSRHQAQHQGRIHRPDYLQRNPLVRCCEPPENREALYVGGRP